MKEMAETTRTMTCARLPRQGAGASRRTGLTSHSVFPVWSVYLYGP
jgi:hypothetical protein